MYDYVKRNYNVDPVVGERVRHTELRRDNTGMIAPESPGQGNYVMVKLDGHDHASPCHPHALEYLGPFNRPTDPGNYVGDLFYGDPACSTDATHTWTGIQWIRVPKAKDFGNG